MREPTRSKGAASLLGFAAATALTALLGSRSTRRGRDAWYERLEKPPFQPPAWIFAPAWTALYGLVAVSGWRIYRQPRGPGRRRALALWAAQLGLNGLWSWLFFARRRPRAALLDCALLLATSGAYATAARRVDRGAARLFAPYVGWVGFATLLNAEIVRRNPQLAAGEATP